MMARLSTIVSRGRWPALLAFALWPAAGVCADKPPVRTAADYWVPSIPDAPKDAPPIKMHAGHIEVNAEDNGNMFFWHFENQHIADKQRTVIWVNGGPGCSSEDGALIEVGPYRMQEDDTLKFNNATWNEFANLLFVDNPVGTGFSYVDTNKFVHELDDMGNQFIKFLEEWFKIFPHYAKDDIYIAGESFAGQYIPYIAKAILARNKQASDPWNLQGLLIGNGWISPYQQYDAYIPFALESKLFEENSDIHKQLLGDLRVCKQRLVTDPGHVDYQECEKILTKILELTRKGSGDNDCVNMYDVRLRDSYPSCGMNWPPGIKSMEPYLRRADVVKALHINAAKNTGWQECNGAVGQAFTAKNSKPSVEYLADLLKEIPVLLFSGAEDLICNYMGTESLIDELTWNGAKGWASQDGKEAAPRRNWTFDGKDAGFWQEARNLTYVLFRESSHMVPFDTPRRSRDMLDRFMGVDVSHIGGDPVDSRLDGEKGPSTSVRDATTPKPEAGGKEGDEKVNEAKWAAYQRSGEVVLIIVIIAATAWGYFIWRERRKRAAYQAVASDDFRGKSQPGDLESAAFQESELDDLHPDTPTAATGSKYAVGDNSEDEDGAYEKSSKNKASGSS